MPDWRPNFASTSSAVGCHFPGCSCSARETSQAKRLPAPVFQLAKQVSEFLESVKCSVILKFSLSLPPLSPTFYPSLSVSTSPSSLSLSPPPVSLPNFLIPFLSPAPHPLSLSFLPLFLPPSLSLFPPFALPPFSLHPSPLSLPFPSPSHLLFPSLSPFPSHLSLSSSLSLQKYV